MCHANITLTFYHLVITLTSYTMSKLNFINYRDLQNVRFVYFI
jgi:hypothetical protein